MSSDRQYTGHFRKDFIRNLRLDFFDEEEIRALLAELDSLDPAIRQQTFALCHSLSHASSSLVPNTLRRIQRASRSLSPKDLGRWIGHAYDLLDHHGIGPFLSFISRIDEETLRDFTTHRGLRLQEVAPVLETFLQGISGRELRIVQDTESHTDTVSVYLPAVVDRYVKRSRNYSIFKFMVSHQWAQLTCGTLTPDEAVLRRFLREETPGEADIASLFSQFGERSFAIDLYTVLEGIRLEAFLVRELPGLMREIPDIKKDIMALRPTPLGSSLKETVVEGLLHVYLNGDTDSTTPEVIAAFSDETRDLKDAPDAGASLRLLHLFYEAATRQNGGYVARKIPLLGTIRPDEVSLQMKAERRARRQMIKGMITRLMTMTELRPREMPHRKQADIRRAPDPLREYLLIKGRAIELDRELKKVLEERGCIPGGIIVHGSDLGGSVSPLSLQELVEDEEEIPGRTEGGMQYDEWDYKRGGYKTKWCSLHEKTIHPGHEPFVEQTRSRYSGYISILRKKFELLKREPRIVRRQKEGDDIDLDATVEAFTDLRAGLSPRDDLFTRYDRQERDIAVLFLLDMSGSTKGWICEAEKEALVLMAEALESLGDRYAIFGFSGMTRNRCDYYRIKGFEEAYAETVKRRISGIMPKDYTRMGPPIRHSVHILKSIEARTKLLITLSDGRPEDYDAYRGAYAMEDTRKALTEAKEQGVHPFCVTIDREARSYLRHMYGEANYIIIDDVRQLPGRITDIYRRLTV